MRNSRCLLAVAWLSRHTHLVAQHDGLGMHYHPIPAIWPSLLDTLLPWVSQVPQPESLNASARARAVQRLVYGELPRIM